MGRNDYRVTVTGLPRNAYVRVAKYGSIDALSDGLRLDRAPTGTLDIVVSTGTGSIDGSVQNERQQPEPNVTVVLTPDPAHRNRFDLYRTTSTDAMGHFHAEGIPPGDYRVFSVWADVENGAWQDPDFMRRFEDRGRPVRITEAGVASIELRLIPAQ